MRWSFATQHANGEWQTSAGRWDYIGSAIHAMNEWLRTCAEKGHFPAVRLVRVAD